MQLPLYRGLRSELSRVEGRIDAAQRRVEVLEQLLERELRSLDGHQRRKSELLAEAVRRAAKLASTKTARPA